MLQCVSACCATIGIRIDSGHGATPARQHSRSTNDSSTDRHRLMGVILFLSYAAFLGIYRGSGVYGARHVDDHAPTAKEIPALVIVVVQVSDVKKRWN